MKYVLPSTTTSTSGDNKEHQIYTVRGLPNPKKGKKEERVPFLFESSSSSINGELKSGVRTTLFVEVTFKLIMRLVDVFFIQLCYIDNPKAVCRLNYWPFVKKSIDCSCGTLVEYHKR